MTGIYSHIRTGAARAYRRARRARAKSCITRVITVTDRAMLPVELHPRRLYVVGARRPKWALLDCPCGRGHTIELNLTNPTRSRWEVTTGKDGRPSIHPSIDFQGQPQCHYWLKDGRIHWVANTTPPLNNFDGRRTA